VLKLTIYLGLTAILISRQGSPLPINPDQPLSVCKVLSDLDLYRGKVVRIVGEWDGGLVGDCPPVRRHSRSWPSRIAIDFPQSLIVKLEEPADWTVAGQVYVYALIGAWREWDQLPTPEKNTKSVVATMVGRVDARDSVHIAEGNEMFGYGHLGGSPARLVLVELQDIRIATVGKRVAQFRPPLGGF